MPIRALFNIILKVLGLFIIKDGLVVISQLFWVCISITKTNFFEEGIWTLTNTIIALLVYALVLYYLILKSELIIDKLKLDKGFDQETIPLNIHRSTILSISIIVIGGLIVVDQTPNLCRQLLIYFQTKSNGFAQSNTTISYSALAAVKIIIGLLLIGYQRSIVNFIEYYRKK